MGADELLGALVLQLDVAVNVELVVVTVVALRALDLARLSLQQLPPLVGLHVRLKERNTIVLFILKFKQNASS